MRKLSLMSGAMLPLLPGSSEAHVKWFSAYDTTVAPLPMNKVITPTFAVIALLFCAVVFAAYVIDRWADRSDWAKRLDNAIFSLEKHTGTIMRVAVGVLFVVLWHAGGLILTPELHTTAVWVPALQLGIAATMLFRPALKFGALGIMVLYIYAVGEYGAFHMMDYPVFPGVGVYLALTGARNPNLRALRLPVLYAGVAVTMMWGAIEKFGYPEWTFPLLAMHQQITFGFSPERFMYIAGFVEFSLAFFMVTGTTLLRWSCAALLLLMVGAIPEFGSVDAVGHLVIIASLVAMIITGQRIIQLPVALARSGVVVQAGALTLAYSTTIAIFFAMYYSSQIIAGR